MIRSSLSHLVLLGSALICANCPSRTLAVTAVGLSSFEGIEESLVRYEPAKGTFTKDPLVNITEAGTRTFRMYLRYRSDVWDGDRDTQNKDRQRAEVKGLGPHQKLGDAFEYTTTWRTSPTFQGSERFCHVFQLKSTNGDSGMPAVTLSILAGQKTVQLQYASGHDSRAVVARSFTWKPDTWQTVVIRIKTSETNDGEVLASVNGDEFQGVRDVSVYRADANDYRPKWGLYRGLTTGLPLGDDFVEHRDIRACKVGAGNDDEQIRVETAALLAAAANAESELTLLAAQPSSSAQEVAITSLVTAWAGHDPAAALNWIETSAPASVGAAARLHAFNRWADQDAGAALRWATNHAPAKALDELLWYFTTDSTLRYVDREKALAALPLITDPQLRELATEHVCLIWARTDRDAANSFVQNADFLTPAGRNALEQKIAAVRSSKPTK